MIASGGPAIAPGRPFSLPRPKVRSRAEGEGAMITFSHVIADIEGLHARPVALIASEARKWSSRITVTSGMARADATDLMGLMGMDARQGDELTVTVDGPDEEAAAEALRAVFSF